MCYNIAMENTSTADLTDRQLKWSYWYVTHKLSLRRAWMIFLAFIAVLVWAYVVWQLIVFAMTYKTIQQNIQTILFTSDASLSAIEKAAPQPPSVSDMTVMGAGNKYDYLVEFSNLNTDWLAKFKYRFTTPSSTENDFRHGFALPGDQKYLMDLSKSSPQASLEIKDLTWQKVNNFDFTKEKMMRFVIDNIEIFKAIKSSDPTKVAFTVKNDSAYGYWQVDLQSLLLSGGNVVGVNHVVLNSLKAGENREVEIFWNDAVSNFDSVDVIINLDIFDADNIMPPR